MKHLHLIGVVKVVDSVVASGERFERLAESSRIAGATLEEHRTPEAASPPLASPASASFSLFLPAFALHQRALRSIKLHQDRIVVRNPQQKRLLDLGWSNLT